MSVPRNSFARVASPLALPWPLQVSLESAAQALLDPGERSPLVFSRPFGEPALLSPDSMSWRVFKNPLALFIGGIAAVIMELAEPRVRTGVWEHTTFRVNPNERLRRTGRAAMVTVFAARSTAETMIARVRTMHDAVAGVTPSGETYRANDPELLSWVQATAAYGFLQAYHVYVQPLSPAERDCYFAEAVATAQLYGAIGAPRSEAECLALFDIMAGRLQRSAIVHEFLAIMRMSPILPLVLRPAQPLLVRAAIALTPRWMRTLLGLDGRALNAWETAAIRHAGNLADRLVLDSNPAVQACRRLRLPADYLYTHHK